MTAMRVDCLFIKNAQNETLWTRSPFFPLERTALSLDELEKQHGEPLKVGLSYIDRFGTEIATKDITDEVRAIPAHVLQAAKTAERCPVPL